MTERELLQNQWRSVADELSIGFIAPFVLKLPDQTHVEFAILLPQFGGVRGMLIDTQQSQATSAAAIAAGFGISTMSPEHHHLPVKATDFIECLIDWTWTDSTAAPAWYTAAV
jgi:hypothetical protein